jgi:hypothetical protein
MIVVLEIAIIAPTNTLSSKLQPKTRPKKKAEPCHQERLDDRRDTGGGPDPHQLREAELETERKHEEDDAQLREGPDDVPVGTNGNGTCGPISSPAMMYPRTTGCRSR